MCVAVAAVATESAPPRSIRSVRIAVGRQPELDPSYLVRVWSQMVDGTGLHRCQLDVISHGRDEPVVEVEAMAIEL